MQFFKKLGGLIEARWRARHYDEQVFPEIAEAALVELPPSQNVSTYAALQWLLGAPEGEVPRQRLGFEPEFGQPPVQVFVSPHFYIEVLYWMDGSTSIHEHSFNGAFHVLAGSSIHCLYAFEEERRYNSAVRLGKVERQAVELLATGDTRRILAGKAMAHSLFHLDRPSVTVVVRTHGVPGADPQYNYWQPGLAEDPFRPDALLSRKLGAISTLAKVEHPELDHIVSETLRNADAHLLVSLALDLRSRFARKGQLRALLEPSRARHGALVDALATAMEEMNRQAGIYMLRGKLRSADHRFFLALLLHFTTGAEVLDFVARRYPEQDSRALVAGWLRECTQLPDPDDASKKVINVRLDDTTFEVIKLMVGGRDLEGVKAALAEEFDADDIAAQADDLARMHKTLIGHPIFGALFR